MRIWSNQSKNQVKKNLGFKGSGLGLSEGYVWNWNRTTEPIL